MVFIDQDEAFMAIRVDTTISIRSEYGVTLGRLLQVSDKQLLVEASTKFRPGSKLEFQLELPTAGAAVYGLAQVTRVTAYNDAPNRYLLGISQMATKDRRAYQQWLYELAQQGGTADRGSSIISTLGERPPADPAPTQPKPAVDRQWSAGSSVSGSRQNVGRAAVREALRARFAGRKQAQRPERGIPREAPSDPVGRYGMDASSASHSASPSSAAPPPRPARPVRSAAAEAEFSSKIHRARGLRSRTAGGGDITITHSPEAEQQFSARQPEASPSTAQPSPPHSKGTALRRVEVKLSLNVNPPLISLRYPDAARFAVDYRDYLSKDAAFVRWSGTKPGHRAEVSVQLVLPSGVEISTTGQVVAIMPSGFGLSLRLSDGDRERIVQETETGG